MKKNIKLILITAIGLISPAVALAVNFSNPATGFLVDLKSNGRDNTFLGLISFLISIALDLVGLVAVAFIIYGGFQYITSRGDEELAAAGKKTLTNAIIGLVIVILSYIIVSVINNGIQCGAYLCS